MSATPRPFDKIGADRLADEVAVLVRRGLLDSRSPAADALLDYRQPPSSARADRMATLERQRDALVAAVREGCWLCTAGRPAVEGRSGWHARTTAFRSEDRPCLLSPTARRALAAAEPGGEG